jgi:hypothetical protein
MADSLSPLSPVNRDSNTSTTGGGGPPVNKIWPLSVSLGPSESPMATRFRADGRPMQKRGPKPRNKPALTRKQELARKAQRNHRERKELYVKALEQEVLLLKDDVCTLSTSNDRLQEEIRQLKRLLERQRTSCSPTGGSNELAGELNGPYRLNSAIPGTYCLQVPNPSNVQDGISEMIMSPPSAQASSQSLSWHETESGIDYDQAGIYFVLRLERPCLDHMRDEPESHLYGHALMASCAPGLHPQPNSEMTSGYHSDIALGKQSYSLSKPGLANLLERSWRLNLDGEVTPVMAWDMILNHPRFLELRPEDFRNITEDLGGKVKCYGFGAIFEEFEVRDAIENILSTKPRLDRPLENNESDYHDVNLGQY